MGYYSRAELVAELELIDAAIHKAYNAISYGTSGGDSLTRPSLEALTKRKKEILQEIEQIDGSGATWNRVRFREARS